MNAISLVGLYSDYEPQFHKADRDAHPGKLLFAPVRLTQIQDLRSPAMAWVSEAPCSETDPDTFFPGPHEDAQAAQAKAICAGCPTRQSCLEFALATPQADDWGVWGGTTEDERRDIRRKRTRGLAA